MANKGQVQAKWSASYPTACWSFEWTSVPVSGRSGKTKISWNLYRRGRSASPTQLRTACDFWLRYNGNWVQIKNYTDSTVSFNDVLVNSGSFEVNHANDGSGTFDVWMEGFIYEYDNKKKLVEQTVILDNNYPYTSCIAPTSIRLTKTIYAPGAACTVEWSGAQGGNQNPIKCYRIWYQIDGSPWSSPMDTTNSSTTNYTFNLPDNATRGRNLQVCVRAIGSVSGYDSGDTYTIKSAAKINSMKPEPPTTNSKLKYSHEEYQNATLEFVVGEVASDALKKEIWYSLTGDTKDEKKYTETLNPWANDSESLEKAYTVWTWDGAEYSEPLVIVVERNINAPSGTILLQDFQAMESENEEENGIYTYSFQIDFQPNVSRDSTFTFQMTYNEKAKTIKAINDNEPFSFTIEDIREYMDPEDLISNQFYTISCLVNDGIEEATVVENKVRNLYVTRVPSLKGFRAKDKNDDFIEAPIICSNFYYSNKFQVCFEKDSGYPNLYIGNMNYGYDSKTDNYLAFNLDILDRGKSATIEYSIGDSKFKSKPWTQTITRTLLQDKKRTLVWDGVYEPFYGNASDGFQIVWPFYEESLLEQYGFFGDDFLTNLRCSWDGADSIQITKTSFDKNGEITTTILNEKLFDNIENFNGLDGKTRKLILKLNNKYGDEFSAYVDKTISMKDKISITSGPTLLSNGKVLGGTAQNLKEGSKIQAQLSFSSYYNNPYVGIFVNGQWCDASSKIVQTNNIEQVSPGKPHTFDLADVILAVGQILIDTKETGFRVKINSSYNGGFEEDYNYGNEIYYRSHVKPTVVIQKGEFNDSQLNLIVTKEDWGLSDYTSNNKMATLIYRFDNNENKQTTQDSNINLSEWNAIVFPDSWEKVEIYIRLSSTSQIEGNDDTTVYESDSNAIYIFNARPTVSYRKNKIGINHTFESVELQDAALVVGEHTNSKKVYFYGQRETTQGEAQPQISSIDLKTGGLTGFVVDGGSWTGTPGGIIPGGSGGDVPISDLYQDAIIIITAGGAFD